MPEIKQYTNAGPIVVLPCGMDCKIGTPDDASSQHMYTQEWNVGGGTGQGLRIGNSYITKSIRWQINLQRLADSDADPLALLPVTFRVIWFIDTMPNQTLAPVGTALLTNTWGTSKRSALCAGYNFTNRSRWKILHDKKYTRAAPVVRITNTQEVRPSDPLPSPFTFAQLPRDAAGDNLYLNLFTKLAVRIEMDGVAQAYVNVRKSAICGIVLCDHNESDVEATNHWFLQSVMTTTFTDA